MSNLTLNDTLVTFTEYNEPIFSSYEIIQKVCEINNYVIENFTFWVCFVLLLWVLVDLIFTKHHYRQFALNFKKHTFNLMGLYVLYNGYILLVKKGIITEHIENNLTTIFILIGLVLLGFFAVKYRHKIDKIMRGVKENDRNN